jgi:hypothetical protein
MDHPVNIMPSAPSAPSASIEEKPLEALQTQRDEDLAVQRAIDEVLEYHRTHRPKNTTKNYEPKQREWKASILFSFWTLLTQLLLPKHPLLNSLLIKYEIGLV